MSSRIESAVNELQSRGLCQIPGLFSREEIDQVNRQIDLYTQNDNPGIVYEEQGQVIRAIHGPHLYDDHFTAIARNPLILDIVKRHLGEDVYIHQYKINMKQGMDGKVWPWHQDFVFWQQNDHIEQPHLVNVAIALNDTSMLNGPLCFIPNSHLDGNLCVATSALNKTGEGSSWRDDVSAELSFQIEKDVVAKLLEGNEPTFGTAEQGDVQLFDPQLAHCSGNNMSPQNRRLLIITYNALSNAPKAISDRPVFLCATDTSPL